MSAIDDAESKVLVAEVVTSLVLGLLRRLVVAQDLASCDGYQRCDLTCPLGLEPSRGEGTSATCRNCGRCIDACAEGSLSFRWRRPLDPGQRRPGLVQLEKG